MSNALTRGTGAKSWATPGKSVGVPRVTPAGVIDPDLRPAGKDMLTPHDGHHPMGPGWLRARVQAQRAQDMDAMMEAMMRGH